MTDDRDFVTEQAQLEALVMQRVTDDLASPLATSRLARSQIAATIELLKKMDRELEQCAPTLDVESLAAKVSNIYREARGMGDSPVRTAAYFAHAIDAFSRLADGQTPVGLDARDVEALRLAVRAKSVGTAALTYFAMAYPEHAKKIDRVSLDRLVAAFSEAGVPGGRWPVVADVWKRRFGKSLTAQSIKNEIAKIP